MNYSSQAETLQRIQSALEAARDVLSRFTSGAIEAEYKAGHDPAKMIYRLGGCNENSRLNRNNREVGRAF
jgi:hypothetical protein